MDTNLILTSTPATGLSSFVAASATAPTWTVQGAALSFAGSKAAHAPVAVAGARTTDLPVPVPRGAPV